MFLPRSLITSECDDGHGYWITQVTLGLTIPFYHYHDIKIWTPADSCAQINLKATIRNSAEYHVRPPCGKGAENSFPGTPGLWTWESATNEFRVQWRLAGRGDLRITYLI